MLDKFDTEFVFRRERDSGLGGLLYSVGGYTHTHVYIAQGRTSRFQVLSLLREANEKVLGAACELQKRLLLVRSLRRFTPVYRYFRITYLRQLNAYARIIH